MDTMRRHHDNHGGLEGDMMALLVFLLVAALLSAAARVLAGRRVRSRGHRFADTEKGVAGMPTADDGESHTFSNAPSPRSLRSAPAKSPHHLRCDDSQAANDQLLSELAASTALDRSDSCSSAHPKAVNPKPMEHLPEEKSRPASEDQPILVNPKQFHRILKRRAARQAMEDSLRLVAQRMERGRELRSMRGFDGVVAGAVR